jgi:hypothetical protein
MADDPIRAYQGALREYQAARDKAKEFAAYNDKVSRAMQSYAAALLVDSYGLQPPSGGERLPRPARGERLPDMSQWPDAAAVRATMEAWCAALIRAQSAWELLPAEDRTGISPPPQRLSLN